MSNKNLIKKAIVPMSLSFLFTMFSNINVEAASKSKSAELQRGSEVKLPLDKEELNRIDDLVNKNIAEGVFPGGAILVAKDGVVVYEKAFGDAQKYDMGNLLETSKKAKVDTIYDLASTTKVMGTTQAVMKLSYEGKLNVNDKVVKYIPEFGKNGKENVKIKDLLTHTSGLTPWKPTYYHATNPKEELEFICDLPLEYETGTARKYSDFSFMTLGFIVEAVSGQTLDKYVENSIYKPLKMNDTMFTPLTKNSKLKDRIAATSWGNPYEYKMVADDDFGYKCDEKVEDFKGWRNYTLIGESNDGNSWYANQGVAGHAGVFSTVGDLAILGQLILNGGSYNDVTLYDKATVDEFTSIQSSFGHGYGWEINRGGENAGYMGKYADDNVFGHTGFTGTQVVFDKVNNLQIISLTNKQNNGVNPTGNYASTFKFSRDLSNIVYEAMLPEFNVDGVKAGESYEGQVKPTVTEGVNTSLETLLDGESYNNEPISKAGEHELIIKAKSKYGKELTQSIKFNIKNPPKNVDDKDKTNDNSSTDKEDTTGKNEAENINTEEDINKVEVTNKQKVLPQTGNSNRNGALAVAALFIAIGTIIRIRK